MDFVFRACAQYCFLREMNVAILILSGFLYFYIMTINCKGQLLDLSTPVVMGILNITPDSFHEKSRMKTIEAAMNTAKMMVADGAKILDLGAMSSRPGADVITAEEELGRILPFVKAIHKVLPDTILSIDTVRSSVALECLEAGAHIINDISGASIDSKLIDVIAKYKVPYILMHMKGTPDTMQSQADYKDVTMEVLAYMSNHIRALRAKGIHDIIIDPGFGFAKLDEHNFALMRQLGSFKMLECPILAGVSRKSTIQRTLEVDAANALNGTTALHMYLLERGANILRTHDVKEAVEVVKLWKRLNF